MRHLQPLQRNPAEETGKPRTAHNPSQLLRAQAGTMQACAVMRAGKGVVAVLER